MEFSHCEGSLQQQDIFHPFVQDFQPLGWQQQQRHFPVLTETE